MRPLVKLWKSERDYFHPQVTYPVGQKPDGIAWTGFLTVCEDVGYVLLFRELNQSSEFALDLKPYGLSNGAVKVLGGYGTGTVEKGVLKVNVPQKLDYIWLKFYRDDVVCAD